MVTAVVAALAITFPVQQADTATFRDGATAELYAQARVRHIRQDSLVRDYRAAVQTRMDLTAGRSRFARQTALFAHETVARVTWRAPNDLKVEALGVRSAAPIIGIVARMGVAEEEEMRDDFRQEMILDRPWFIPRAFGDSIRLMGVPDRAAVHPFAAGATSRYRYAITDSVTLIVPGRTVRAVGMRVEPKRLGPSLVAGEMWLDRETADVVRMVVVFVGEYLWEEPDGSSPSDSADARDDNEWANRFLTVEADVEYALVDGRYWLPHRQFLAITAEIPWFVNAALPARAVSTFSNYEVNTSPMMSFVVQPDELDDLDERSTRVLVATGDGLVDEEEADTGETRYHTGYLRAGNWDDGHWEVVVPPAESLLAYDWQADFRVALDAQEQERLTQSLISLAIRGYWGAVAAGTGLHHATRYRKVRAGGSQAKRVVGVAPRGPSRQAGSDRVWRRAGSRTLDQRQRGRQHIERGTRWARRRGLLLRARHRLLVHVERRIHEGCRVRGAVREARNQTDHR
jgi:hypothetical protein